MNLLHCVVGAIGASIPEEDLREVDAAFHSICKKTHLFRCQEDPDGNRRTMQGQFGKVLFASVRNDPRNTWRIIRQCAPDLRDKRPTPRLLCADRRPLGPWLEPWVPVVIKLPFRRQMRIENATRGQDNLWLKERRSFRRFAEWGLTPRCVDIVGYRLGDDMQTHSDVPKQALIMDHADGLTLPRFLDLVLGFGSEMPPEEVWVRLRAASKVLLLYVGYVRRIWQLGIRHCDIHWGNVIMRRHTSRLGNIRKKWAPDLWRAGILMFPHERCRHFGKGKLKNCDPLYLLDAHSLTGLDVSFAVEKSEPFMYGHACLAHVGRREDLWEVNRSLLAAVAAAMRKEDTLVGPNKAAVLAWRKHLVRALSDPELRWCLRTMGTIFDTHAPRFHAINPEHWMLNVIAESEHTCNDLQERRARDRLEEGLLTTLRAYDDSMPAEAKEVGFTRTQYMVNPEIRTRLRALVFNLTSDFKLTGQEPTRPNYWA